VLSKAFDNGMENALTVAGIRKAAWLMCRTCRGMQWLCGAVPPYSIRSAVGGPNGAKMPIPPRGLVQSNGPKAGTDQERAERVRLILHVYKFAKIAKLTGSTLWSSAHLIIVCFSFLPSTVTMPIHNTPNITIFQIWNGPTRTLSKARTWLSQLHS